MHGLEFLALSRMKCTLSWGKPYLVKVRSTFGMFPRIRTVLSRDYGTPCSNSPVRAIRGASQVKASKAMV